MISLIKLTTYPYEREVLVNVIDIVYVEEACLDDYLDDIDEDVKKCMSVPAFARGVKTTVRLRHGGYHNVCEPVAVVVELMQYATGGNVRVSSQEDRIK